ncbi:hypothetical protein MSG28_006304 [Choristoneura fumiferana]|uniref:Uncharacterized protein n=1 Tax=Choristoneura fumiferana TaxID=7141 RepID=A0ACC0JEE4_CHOFU|nr:hypothetical protein MSG28_006304 [Choristoneura fumiferana]
MRDETDAKQLTITAATHTAGGRYTCEVSADAPSFQTAQVHTHMYVVAGGYLAFAELFMAGPSLGEFIKDELCDRLEHGKFDMLHAEHSEKQFSGNLAVVSVDDTLNNSSENYFIYSSQNYLPQSDPVMIGMKRRYRAGMTLKAECFSKNSNPAANLSFFINSEPALSQHVWHRVDVSENNGLMTAYSTIQFVVQKHHFIGERIKMLVQL